MSFRKLTPAEIRRKNILQDKIVSLWDKEGISASFIVDYFENKFGVDRLSLMTIPQLEELLEKLKFKFQIGDMVKSKQLNTVMKITNMCRLNLDKIYITVDEKGCTYTVYEESLELVEDNKMEFNKSMLKDGMMVKFRNGEIGRVNLNRKFFELNTGGQYTFQNYDDNLRRVDSRKLDVVEIFETKTICKINNTSKFTYEFEIDDDVTEEFTIALKSLTDINGGKINKIK